MKNKEIREAQERLSERLSERINQLEASAKEDIHEVEEEVYRKAAIATIKKFNKILSEPAGNMLASIDKYLEYLAWAYDITKKDLN